MLPEGTVQTLAFKLEEGQVLLSHSPAEVIAVQENGDEDSNRDQGGPQTEGPPELVPITGPDGGGGKQGKGMARLHPR